MRKNDILYFEEDDASELSSNGKQVFVTKRINGKTTHNKLENIENANTKKLSKKEEKNNEEKDNEIILGIDRFYIPNENNDKNKSKNKEKKKNNQSNSKPKNKPKNKKQIKRKKKKKRNTKTIKILILLILIVGTVIFALVSPTFNIQTITVQGNEKVNADTIISLSKLQVGNNIFKNINTEIISNIKENPYIENVAIKRILPGTIEIAVTERTIEYQIKVIDSYIYIDYQGYILEKSAEKANVPIIEGFTTSQDDLLKGKRVCSIDIGYLNAIIRIIENAKNLDMYDKITKIIVEDDEYILYLENEKKYAYIGDDSNLTNKMLYVQAILEKEKKCEGKIFVNGNLDDGFKPYFREENIDGKE